MVSPMTNYKQRFWSHEKYDDVVKAYDRHTETTHPNNVSSNRLSPYAYYGTWGRTAVTYYEYRGPRQP